MWYKIDFSRPPQLLRIGRIHYTDNWNCKGKVSSGNKFVFVIKGKVRYTLDGNVYDVKRGGCIFIKKGVFYTSELLEICEFCVIHFDGIVSEPVSDEDAAEHIKSLKNECVPHKLSVTEDITRSEIHDVYIKQYIDISRYFEQILLLISKCESNRYMSYPGSTLYMDNRLAHLILHISRDAMSEVIQIIETPSMILKMTLYIQHNYTKPITLASIAQEFGLSKQYIIRIFKKHLGMTVTKYINNMRLEHSLELLKNSSMNINEIAEFLGFNSAYYFCRIFKATYFITPTEYIKSDTGMDYGV